MYRYASCKSSEFDDRILWNSGEKNLRRLGDRGQPYLQLLSGNGNPRERPNLSKITKWLIPIVGFYIDGMITSTVKASNNRSDYFGDDLSFIAYVVAEGSRVYSTRFGKKVLKKITSIIMR